MSENISKQILDSTFQHLEKAIEEMRQDKYTKKKKKVKVSDQKDSDAKKSDSD
jgi:hypothetical protein